MQCKLPLDALDVRVVFTHVAMQTWSAYIAHNNVLQHHAKCAECIALNNVLFCKRRVPSAERLIMCCFPSAECITQYTAKCNIRQTATALRIIMRLHDVKCGAAGAKTVRDSTSPSPVHLDRCLMLEITAQDRFVHLCQITLIFCGAADTVCDGIIMILHGNGGSYEEKKQCLTLTSLKHV